MNKNFAITPIKLEEDIKSFLGQRIREESSHVPIETDLDPKDFQTKYVLRNRPVILRGVVDKWSASSKWDFNYFANEYGEIEVNVNLYDLKNTKQSNLKSLVKDIKNSDSNNPVYLQEWWFQTVCPNLLNDIKVPEYFVNDQNLKLFGFYNSTLWIGAKGAFTPIHQDSVFSNVWTAQIRGKKEWILFDKNAVLKSDGNGGGDYDDFLSNQNNGVIHCTLEAGDILYVPYKWWHRAQTLEDAISLNTFYITDEIVKRYISNVFSIPMAVALNRDLLQQHDMMRYNICMTRINILSELLGYDKENILKIKSC